MEVPVSSIINIKSVVANVFSILIFRTFFFFFFFFFFIFSLSLFLLFLYLSLFFRFMLSRFDFSFFCLSLSLFSSPILCVFVHSKHTHMYVIPFAPAHLSTLIAYRNELINRNKIHTLFPYSFR